MRRTRVRLTKQSLVDRAVENGVKPFTALAGLLSLALRNYLAKTRSSIPTRQIPAGKRACRMPFTTACAPSRAA